MNTEIYTEWLRRQGHHVVRTESSFWYDAGPRIYQAFPYAWEIEPSRQELRRLLLGKGGLALRYSTPIGAATGKISYHVVLSNPYNLELLRSQARNAVKRGLANCQVEQIPFERLAGEGWSLERDTLDRQGRLGIMSESAWRQVCLAGNGLPGIEAWAAVINGELAAALLIARVGDTFYVPYSLSHRKFLDQYVNNALFYSVSTNVLAREGVSGIFFTVQSLDAPKSVDEFKFRMGLKAKAVRQKVVFNPLLEPFIKNPTHKLVNKLLQHYPEAGFLAKAEGMIRFYLQGKQPIEKQQWPDCLSQSMPEVIASSTHAVTT